MEGIIYQTSAMRTNDGKATDRLETAIKMNNISVSHKIDIGGLLNGCLGLSGEAGEFNDMIKKHIFHEKELDIEHLKKECGDILWYVAMICHSMNWNMDEIMQMNIDKLKARYPEGFNIEQANNRSKEDI